MIRRPSGFWTKNRTLAQEIIEYYEANGRNRTQEKYPEYNISSIIRSEHLRHLRKQNRKSFWLNHQDLAKEIIKHYEEHGVRPTIEKYPQYNVASLTRSPWMKKIVIKPRQVKWTDEQLILLVKFSGLLDKDIQAKAFNRPNANGGSILSVWNKRFKFKSTELNGLRYHTARHLIIPGCPIARVKMKKMNNLIVLWADMEKNLREDLPRFIVDAIKAMAEFQRWLHGTKDQIIETINKFGGSVTFVEKRDFSGFQYLKRRAAREHELSRTDKIQDKRLDPVLISGIRTVSSESRSFDPPSPRG